MNSKRILALDTVLLKHRVITPELCAKTHYITSSQKRKSGFSKSVARREEELLGALYSRPSNPLPSKMSFRRGEQAQNLYLPHATNSEKGIQHANQMLRQQHAPREASLSRLQSFSVPIAHFLTSGPQVLRQAD